MSGLDKAWPRFASRRGRVLAAGAGAVAVLALAGLRGSADVARPVAVKRQDLVQTVEVEGELQAVRSTEVGVPPVRDAEFKIAFLIPEGTAVKKGQPVLGFDTEALQRQLVEKEAEFQEAAKKVDQKEIDLGLKLLDVEQRSAQAVADLLVGAGVRGILNFAPVLLRLPPRVRLVTVDLTIQLEQLAFLVQRDAAGG